MNLFDGLQDKAFDVTTKVMGYDASWTPVGGGSTQTASVHLRFPTELEIINGRDGMSFSPVTYIIEWRSPFFPGLFDSVRSGVEETLTVNGETYRTRASFAYHDGRTLRVYVDKV